MGAGLIGLQNYLFEKNFPLLESKNQIRQIFYLRTVDTFDVS